MTPLVFRIAARYQRATEFASPEALRDYLREHPGADPKNHSVRKPEEHGHEEAPRQSFRDRLKSLGAKAKSFVSNLPTEAKKFVQDDAHRRTVLMQMHKTLTELPEKTLTNAKHAVKHEIHEFRTAGEGIRAVLRGEKMTKEQKKAVKLVAFDVALTVATVAVSGGLAAGAKGMAVKTVEAFSKALAKKLALNAVTHGLGNVVTLEELGHFGHGIHNLVHHLTAAEKKGDDRDLIVAYVTKIVSDQVRNLSPDVLAEALEEASGT